MSIERATYIHFEGMDLAGKTTASKGFIASTGINWVIQRNSIVPDNPIYKLADSLRLQNAYDTETLGNLYVAALMADIGHFKWPEKHTIQDSTIILRSLAVHTVLSTPRISEALLDLLPKHPKFDASFVFTASMEKRLERLQERIERQPDQVSEEDFFVRDKPETFLAMEACLIDIAKKTFHSVIVDTSSMTPDVVVGTIRNNIPHITFESQ